MNIKDNLQAILDKHDLKKYKRTVSDILDLETTYRALSDDKLKTKTLEFKQRLKAGETLEDIKVEAFATVREAAARVLHMRHFPVQLIGGLVLHDGDIAEMKTGEGKTLVATAPAYLNALTGEGVYIVTVNDYLAKRDAEEMGEVFRFLGLSVGLIVSDMPPASRKEAYACDITYGTNNEFGFDYLRDNMSETKEEQVQRGLNYAIIDEVDAILIDEARTPLIISTPGDESLTLYYQADDLAKSLLAKDYEKDLKEKVVTLTASGIEKAEHFFKIDNLSDINHIDIMHAVSQALYANVMMVRDIDYLVKDGEIIIVDEFTGRPMPGRRYSDGLHQAIEAKEGVDIRHESITKATITLQNYFRLFKKIAGMTGTAKTEEDEFRELYHLNTIVIPTNKPVIRKDLNDLVFPTARGKFKAVLKKVQQCYVIGQPVLIGTTSIEKSEWLSNCLRRMKIPHNILNAKQLEKEAQIVALAGHMHAVTIATNMAGRGTDIKLGKGVKEKGGLYIIGTERHESRRIDNQLRGRAGRQGDPGVSQFYVSLEDNLMKRFGSEKIRDRAKEMGLPEDDPIESPIITRSIESAQKKVEAINFSIRKNVVAYDNVMNRQRTLIYRDRQKILDGKNITGQIIRMAQNCDDADTKVVQLKALHNLLDDETFGNLERLVLLKNVDRAWENQIDDMARLRDGIGLRAYGQNDPVQDYSNEGVKLFNAMTKRIQRDTVYYLCQMVDEFK